MQESMPTLHLQENRDALPQVVRGALLPDAAMARPLANIGELWFSTPVMARILQNGEKSRGELPPDAADFDKLLALLAALPRLGATPLQEELAGDLAALGTELPLTPDNAAAIWYATAQALKSTPLTPTDLFARMGTCVLDITPALLAVRQPLPAGTVPLLSLQALLSVHTPQFLKEIASLEALYGQRITDLAGLEAALAAAFAAARERGAHAVALATSHLPQFVRPDPYHAAEALSLALAGKWARLSEAEAALLQAQILRTVGRLAVAHGMRLLLDLSPKNDTVSAPFSPVAWHKLLTYLEEWQALPPLCLTLAPSQYDGGLAALLGAFPDERGVSRLSFGVAGQGATEADMTRALHFFAQNGATVRCIGLTDCRLPCLANHTAARFARAASQTLSLFPDQAYAKAELAALLYGRAAAFFGLS